MLPDAASPEAPAPKISSGTASGRSRTPASAAALGSPAVNDATITAKAASAGVPTASAIRERPRAVGAMPRMNELGSAASSSSGPNVSQCAATFAAPTASSETPRIDS